MDGRIAARVGAGFLIAAALLGARSLRAGAVPPAEAVALDGVPVELAGWVGTDIDVRPEVLELLRPDGFLLREYRRAGEPPLQFYVDYHRAQRLGSTIHSPRVCYPGAGWEPVAIETVDRVGGDGGPGCWLRLRSGEREMVSLYWYETRWGRSARELGLKAGIVRSALGRKASDAALLRFATPIAGGDEAAARERIARFVAVMEPEVRDILPFQSRGGESD